MLRSIAITAIAAFALGTDAVACVNANQIDSGQTPLAGDRDGHVYAGAFGAVYRSCDDGVSWARTETNQNTPLAFLVDPVDAAIVYFSSSHGVIYRSSDYGANFTNVGTIREDNATTANAVALAALADGTLLAATNLGLFESSDSGSSWFRVQSAPRDDLRTILVNPDNESVMLITSHVDTVYRTVDRGVTWEVLAGPDQWYALELVHAPDTASIVFAASATGIFRSVDAGSNWQIVADYDVSDIDFDPGNPAQVFAASRNHGFIVSDDGGNTWIAHSFPPEAGAIVSVHVTAQGDIILGTDGAGILRSADRGASFTRVLDGRALDPSSPPDPATPPSGSNALDVSVRDMHNGEAVPSGSNAHLRFSVTNLGPDASTMTTATVTWQRSKLVGAPIDMPFSVSTGRGVCNQFSNHALCEIGMLLPGETVNIDLYGTTKNGDLGSYRGSVTARNAEGATSGAAMSKGTSVTVLKTGGAGSFDAWMLLALAILASSQWFQFSGRKGSLRSFRPFLAHRQL